MKTKILMALMLILTLSIGSTYAATTNAEAHKTELKSANTNIGGHHHHHRKFHRHHHMMH